MSTENRARGKRETQQPSKRRGLLLGLGITAAVILVLAVVVRMWIRMPDLPVMPDKENNSQLSTGVEAGRKPGVYTFLLAGRDVASGSTDVMILLTYDVPNKTIHGLNLPRDTMINTEARSKRLNAVYARNKGKDKATQVQKGMTALKEEVEKLTGIYPDFYIMVEWDAIGKLVNALGGVEFEVPFDMDYKDPYQDLYIHQKAGVRKLTGEDAMQVVRWRKNSDGSHSVGDVGRLKIQQDFLKAVAKECLKPATFLKLPELSKVFAENVDTDLTVGNILAFAEQARGMDPETGVSFETAPLGDNVRYHGAAMVTLDGPALVELLNEKFNPYTREIGLEDLELMVVRSDGSLAVSGGKGGTFQPDPPKPKPKPQPEPQPEPEPEPEPEPQEPTDIPLVPLEPSFPSEGGTEDPEQPMGPESSAVPEDPDTPMPTEPETPELPGQPDPVLPEPVPDGNQEPDPQPEPEPPEAV